MKNADVPESTQQTFVVTAVFIKQKTVRAKSVSHALELAEQNDWNTTPTDAQMCNWYAHEV